jgi:stage II sporulation protein D
LNRLTWLVVLATAAGCASTVAPPEPATAPVQVAPTPAAREPAPTPTPAPAGPAPGAAEVFDESRPIRVLLRRTGGPITLPQPGRGYFVEADGSSMWLFGPVRIETVASSAWQLGAWSRATTAAGVEEDLRRRFGGRAEVWRESSAEGLVRVRLRWIGGDPANAAALLAEAGFPEAMALTERGVVRLQGVETAIESAAEILLTPAGEWPTAVEGRRYRGRFRLRYLRGEALLVNELGMEDYLRGVVPVEMGPYQFPELEALKAQAVAARTYAVAHLGDHDDEGWDICDTPACQAYHGADAEHRLSDRAVAETRGLIASFGGRPIDAMYTSTCGGHTEDAAALFPDRAQPYLSGVACSWDRPLRLEGTTDSGSFMDPVTSSAAIAREVLGLAPIDGPREIVRAVGSRSGRSAEVPPFHDVEAFADALLVAAGINAPSALVRASSGLEALLGLSDLYGIPLPPPEAGLDGEWPAAAGLAVLELRGDLLRDRGEAVPHAGGIAIYPRRSAASELLPMPLPLWESWSGASRRISNAEVLPGTELERLRIDDRIAALVVRRSGGAGEADRRSAWRSWIRDRTWDELRASTGIPDASRIEVVRRGVSGRVVALSVIGRGGERRSVEGFEIRRALDLPETLFDLQVRTLPSGEKVVRFLGRGWGHGVGMCQNGAYGLARSGMTFDRILEHYYSGIEIEPW